MLSLNFAILLSLNLGLAVSTVAPRDDTKVNNITRLPLPFPTHHLFQFDNVGTYIENVAARSNGDLLFTLVSPTPQIHLLSGIQSGNPQDTTLYEFPDMTSLEGITEISPDVFVVVGGKFYSVANPISGTFSLWQISLAGVSCPPCGPGSSGGQPTITKLMDLPEHIFPNGIVSVPGEPGIIFVADSFGSLLRVDLNSQKIDTVAAVPEMEPVPGWPFAIGINGIKTYNGYIYWTNSFAATMYRMAIQASGFASGNGTSSSNSDNISEVSDDTNEVNINGTSTPATAPTLAHHSNDPGNLTVETVAFLPLTFMDDFAVSSNGSLWITTNPNNTVIAINQDTGKTAVVAGDQKQAVLAGVNAAVFGRLDTDKDILYVVTAGGLTSPVNGTFVEPAKIMAIDTSRAANEGI
ncbi:hypothetical protein PGQ11_008960 [Apiospora arundinis]|uniref:Uncharacterized protein n=1 Tax=Apiospora arundinis TaxID=335852 RepID=A0ABR2IH78_9PEZI